MNGNAWPMNSPPPRERMAPSAIASSLLRANWPIATENSPRFGPARVIRHVWPASFPARRATSIKQRRAWPTSNVNSQLFKQVPATKTSSPLNSPPPNSGLRNSRPSWPPWAAPPVTRTNWPQNLRQPSSGWLTWKDSLPIGTKSSPDFAATCQPRWPS